MIKIGDRVKVISFFDTKEPNENVEDLENYWNLINSVGTVVDIRSHHPYYTEKGPQALVKLDRDLKELNLVSHNNPTNTLWFFMNDLKKMD